MKCFGSRLCSHGFWLKNKFSQYYQWLLAFVSHVSKVNNINNSLLTLTSKPSYLGVCHIHFKVVDTASGSCYVFLFINIIGKKSFILEINMEIVRHFDTTDTLACEAFHIGLMVKRGLYLALAVGRDFFIIK